MPDGLYIFSAIAVCALCTLALRAAPFILFRGGRRLPPAVRRLAANLPAAIIAVLVVYCLKSLPTSPLPDAAATPRLRRRRRYPPPLEAQYPPQHRRRHRAIHAATAALG